MFASNVNQPKTISLIPTDWMAALRQLIKPPKGSPYAPLPDFDTVDALLGACAGDLTAGIMLKRVLKWYESKKGDEFYMSESGWKRQCFVTRHVINRVQRKNFPMVGVSYEIKPAVKGREAVTHYRINILKFMERLAEVVGMTIFKLTVRLAGKRRNVTPESGTTLTIDTPIKTSIKVNEKVSPLSGKVNDLVSSDDPIISVLLQEGLTRNDASRFVDLPIDTVQACIDSSRKPHVKYRIKHLEKSLENQLEKKLNSVPVEAKRDWSSFVNQPVDDAQSDDAPEFQFKGISYLEYRQRQEQQIEMAIRPSVDASAAEAWRDVESRLRSEFGERFEQWFNGAEVDCSGGELVVCLVNRRALDYVSDHRLARQINKIIADECDMTVRFVAPESKPLKFAQLTSD